MANFQLSIVSPEKTVYEDQVSSVIMPAYNGYLGVLSDHEPTITALKPGVVEFVDTNSQRHYLFVSSGFAELSEGKVIILAQDAEISSEIDVAAAEKELEEARKALKGEDSSMTAEEATHALERAMIRAKAAKRS